jgi:predicted nucleic acid-binding protein
VSRAETTTFVDTNVIAYALDLSEDAKRPVAQRALDGLWLGRSGIVSVQVLQELYNVMTRKFSPPMTPSEARAVIADYAAWETVEPDAALILDASLLTERYSVSFCDALVVEAARRSGATTLLTGHLQHGQRFGSLTVENPFADLD